MATSRNLFTSGGSEGAAKVRILAKLLQPLIPHRETASTDADADEGRGTPDDEAANMRK